jgi:hypothetical protein
LSETGMCTVTQYGIRVIDLLIFHICERHLREY